jgi:hypothetical protein
MLFALICTDKPGAQDVRLANRTAHLEFISANQERIRLGGPMLTEDGSGMVGSLIIMEGDSKADVEALAAQDPYAKADLFESVDIRPWKWTVGNPET